MIGRVVCRYVSVFRTLSSVVCYCPKFFLNLCLTSTYFQYNQLTTASTTNSCTEQQWAHQFPLLLQKSLCKTSRNKPSQLTNEHYHSGYVTLTIPLQPYTKTKSTIFTNTSVSTNSKIYAHTHMVSWHPT